MGTLIARLENVHYHSSMLPGSTEICESLPTAKKNYQGFEAKYDS